MIGALVHWFISSLITFGAPTDAAVMNRRRHGLYGKRKLLAMERKTEAEDRVNTERRKAWAAFIANNREREIYVDREVDISHLCDEMNDMEKEIES